MEILTRDEALQALKLKDRNVLTYLFKRGLLIPLKYGTRTYRYDRRDCDRLLERVKTEGILLNIKP